MLRKTNETSLSFGSILQASLKEAHISRRFLADFLQCSEDTIDNWCSGRARITSRHLNALCSLLCTKGGLSAVEVGQIYQTALEAHGFVSTWPPANGNRQDITICLAGTLARRKEVRTVELISDFLGRLNHRVFALHSGNDIRTISSCMSIIERIGVANLLMCGIYLPDEMYDSILKEMDRLNVPVIMVSSNCPKEMVLTHRNVFSVTWSNQEIARRATTMLLDAGHTRIGTVHVAGHEARFAGYLGALKDRNISYDSRFVVHQASGISLQVMADQDATSLESFIDRGDITAIFAPTELLTLSIPVILSKRGKRLYEDISFCGVAYPGWLGHQLNLPLTYLSYPVEEAAHKALDILVRASVLENLKPEERYVDCTGLVRRVDIGRTGSIKSII